MAMTTTNGHMQALASLSVPAGARVIMAPGGTHLMLEGVSPELRIGDTLHLTLHFAHAGDLAVALPVVPYGEMPE
jgi:copper(I)-binding protein